MSDRRRVRRWVPALVWACVIFTFSTGWFSAGYTGGALLPVLEWLFPRWSPERLLLAHAAIRKLAHFAEYLVFGVLLVRAIGAPRRHMLRAGSEALAVGAFFACTDELHQMFVPSRTPAVHDVVIDVSGVAAGVALALWWRAVQRTRRSHALRRVAHSAG